MWDKLNYMPKAFLKYDEMIQNLDSMMRNLITIPTISDGILSFLENPAFNYTQNYSLEEDR